MADRFAMADRVLIPLPGIGTLSLTRAEYEAALIPITRAELPKPERKPEPAQLPPKLLPQKSVRETVEKPRGLRYIRLKEVCQRLGLRQSTIYRLVALGKFPKQVKLSEHAAAWVESEVEAYMEARAAERDAAALQKALPPESPYMRMGEVMRRTGFDASAIYDLIREGNFPKWADLPKISSGWLKSDVEAWLASRVDPLLPKTNK